MRSGPNVSSCGQRRLWSDLADAQADLSLHWAHRSFCWFCHAVAQISTSLLFVLIKTTASVKCKVKTTNFVFNVFSEKMSEA